MKMIAAVQPYIDAAVSKTVNVPRTTRSRIPRAFTSKRGTPASRASRPIGRTMSSGRCSRCQGRGTVAQRVTPQDLKDDTDRRVRLSSAPQPALASLKWPGRPDLAEGNLAWTYMVEIPERQRNVRDFHRRGRRSRGSVRGVGQRSRAAARAGGDRQVAVDGHAQRGSRLAQDEARRAGEGPRRAGLRDSRCRRR